MTSDPVDPSRCPLCGAQNRCAMELQRLTGVEQGPCWCVSQRLDAALLARVPEWARNKACVCAECVRSFESEARS